MQHYILYVQAQDNGQPSLSTTITVYCNVLDLNDNAPLFDPMSYSSEVFENVPIGENVVTVSAKDIDSGKLLFKPFLAIYAGCNIILDTIVRADSYIVLNNHFFRKQWSD